MPIKYLIFIGLLQIIGSNIFGQDPAPYVEGLHEKRYLKLPKGNEVIISYYSSGKDASSKIRIFMRNKDQVLWDKTFINEYSEVWYKANFIPVIPKRFSEDLNGDNTPEIGIAFWGGGMASWESSAVIYF